MTGPVSALRILFDRFAHLPLSSARSTKSFPQTTRATVNYHNFLS
jgi:hypothetical protein